MTQAPPKVAEALESIADRWFAEQRRARRWAGFWRGLIAFYFGLFVAAYLVSNWDTLWTARGPHAAVVKVEGPIGSRDPASAQNVIKALRAAFDNPRAKAVLLAIDSPGGSPVQAELISAEIQRLRGLHPDRPVIAVIADTGASAAYYIAAAAERIYASRASLVGSIGVRIDSFGFDGALRELGVERRLLTAGTNKGILDPFSPLPGEQRAFVQGVLDELARAVHRGGPRRTGRTAAGGRRAVHRAVLERRGGAEPRARRCAGGHQDGVGHPPPGACRGLHAEPLRAGAARDLRGRRGRCPGPPGGTGVDVALTKFWSDHPPAGHVPDFTKEVDGGGPLRTELSTVSVDNCHA